jgi:beta-lactam-binding protein with PASTA domain
MNTQHRSAGLSSRRNPLLFAGLAIACAAPTAGSQQPGVANPSVVIPNVTGLRIQVALDSLVRTKRRVVQIDAAIARFTAESVIAQRPLAGTRIDVVRVETLFVAKPIDVAAAPSGNGNCPGETVEGTRDRRTIAGRLVRRPIGQIQDVTKVPDLARMTPSLIGPALDAACLRRGEEQREYFDAMPLGHVFRQVPLAGKVVTTGTAVSVWYSLGPHPSDDPAISRRVAIPSVIGLSLGEATDSLRRRGFRRGNVDILARKGATGAVVSQSPPANETAHRGDLVDVTITVPVRQVAVPPVIGSSLSAASERLVRSGLGVGRITIASGLGTDTAIASQNPLPRTVVDSGTLVDLVEQRPTPPPRRVSVPSLAGRSIEFAEDTLRKLELTIGTVRRVAGTINGRITSQQPRAGSTVSVDSPIDLTVEERSIRVAVVPRVVGFAPEFARKALATAGFSRISLPRTLVDSLTALVFVETQRPAAGTRTLVTTPMYLTTVIIPRPRVPTLIGLVPGDALVAASIEGFRMVVDQRRRAFRLREQVVSQVPRSGSVRRADGTISVTIEFPAIPPLVAATMGVALGGAAVGAAIRRAVQRRRATRESERSPEPRPQSAAELHFRPTSRLGPLSLDVLGNGPLVRTSLILRLRVETDAWSLTLPQKSLVRSEDERHA